MTLFPHYFSEEVVLRMFHPADGENSGASLAGSVLGNGITIRIAFLFMTKSSLALSVLPPMDTGWPLVSLHIVAVHRIKHSWDLFASSILDTPFSTSCEGVLPSRE